MVLPNRSLPTGHFTQLVAHLQQVGAAERKTMVGLYGAPSDDPAELAAYLVSHPDEVVEVAGDQLDSSLGWRFIGEAVMEHDLGLYLDWIPGRVSDDVFRLGLAVPKQDEQGRMMAVMPAAFAVIFADRVRGQRASLPVLLGRMDDDKVRALAKEWDLNADGSKVEVILRICDLYAEENFLDVILDKLPTPDWIGDALMVIELGGMCYWSQIFGYDLESTIGGGDDKVVPLMRGEDRRYQQEVAERLVEVGVLFRFEHEELPAPMVAVPEELWGQLWELGRRWLMDWTVQALASNKDLALGKAPLPRSGGLQAVLKWWLCEARGQGLVIDEREQQLSPESRRRLDNVFEGPIEFEWDQVWQLGRELRILSQEPYGEVGQGSEAKVLLDQTSSGFIGECLLEWCLGYSGIEIDAVLPLAVGLDETWRGRVVSLLRRQSEAVPRWMELEGVDTESTGGGWLREPGTGTDANIMFEAMLADAFVTLTKVLWLDLLSFLDDERQYPMEGLTELLQCVAGLSMFSQLKLVLEQQPAPVYLPFQRASFLMDPRQDSHFRDWLDDVVHELLVPLGVASISDDGEQVALRTELLKVKDPPGWPEGERQRLLSIIFDEEVEFSVAPSRSNGIRPVASVPEGDAPEVSLEQPLEELLELAKGRQVRRFDGEFIEFE